MRPPTQQLIMLGLVVELALAIFPPMRFTIEPEPGTLVAGRTEHFFVLDRRSGPWKIDAGRFVVYVTAIGVVTALLVLGESSLHSVKSRNRASSTRD